MSQLSREVELNKSQISLSYEGKILFTLLILLFPALLYLQHELSLFLLCCFTAILIAIRFSLPNPNIKAVIKSYCPDFYQANAANLHRLNLCLLFEGTPLPYILVKAKHQSNKYQVIKSSKQLLPQLSSRTNHSINLVIEPDTQGEINFTGIELKSLAGFKVFEWKHFIPLPLSRPIHPKNISLKPLNYLEHFWGEQEMTNSNLQIQQQGEYVGWPRAYQAGDPPHAINWQRLSLQPFEPIVHSAVSSQSQQIHIVLDTALSLRKRGAQKKVHHLCEFTRALTTQLERAQAEVHVVLCSDTNRHFEIKANHQNIQLLNAMARLKVVKQSTATLELERLSSSSQSKLIYLSLSSEHLSFSSLSPNVITLNHSQIMAYFQEDLLESEEFQT